MTDKSWLTPEIQASLDQIEAFIRDASDEELEAFKQRIIKRWNLSADS